MHCEKEYYAKHLASSWHLAVSGVLSSLTRWHNINCKASNRVGEETVCVAAGKQHDND